MDIEDAWMFNIYNLRQGDRIGCPICKVYTPHTAWQDTVVAYEACPSVHQGIICPSCGRVFDYLNDSDLNFKVRSQD